MALYGICDNHEVNTDYVRSNLQYLYGVHIPPKIGVNDNNQTNPLSLILVLRPHTFSVPDLRRPILDLRHKHKQKGRCHLTTLVGNSGWVYCHYYYYDYYYY